MANLVPSQQFAAEQVETGSWKEQACDLNLVREQQVNLRTNHYGVIRERS